MISMDNSENDIGMIIIATIDLINISVLYTIVIIYIISKCFNQYLLFFAMIYFCNYK